ncbi:MAG: aminopeptidase [Lachnospiraceae bacterium]|nr:aminopeptidase [Lachnospiraceae bacterium]
MERKTAWEKYKAKELKAVFSLSEEYRKFISVCKTERECVSESVRLAKEAGFKDLADIIKSGKKVKSGDKIYAVNQGKNIVLFVVGKKPLSEGMVMLGAHIDSPRIDLKQNPLWEDSLYTTHYAMMDTHYYGGIKKYQWVTLPLAIHGVVAKKDGSLLNINIGDKSGDPVIGVSDLLIHLSGEQLDKKGAKVVEGEKLDILVGTIPLKGEEKKAVFANILKILKDEYDFEEEDFMSAELEVVPAGEARDYGLDRSMIMGYGQDDRVCAYTSLLAVLEAKPVDKTQVCILVDKEEVGSIGATGMKSRFFENTVAELMDAKGEYSDLALRRALANSKLLSSDVSAAVDPNYGTVNELKNSAFLGRGIVFNKYTGSRGKSGCNDANAEYMAELRKIMDDGNVSFQTAELGKVDAGGGGTIAYIMARYNMQVIDSGVPVLNMHAPWEITCKADIYEAYKGYKAFLANA